MSAPGGVTECWIIEAVDAYDRWGLVDAPGGGSELASRTDADAALDELVRLHGWDREELRVRAIPAY